jgi:bacillopeptidase F
MPISSTMGPLSTTRPQGADLPMGPAKTPETAPKGPSLAPEAAYQDTLIARMKAHADLSQEALLPRGAERKTAVYQDLLKTAQASQAPTLAKLADLKSQGMVDSFESMFLPNAIVIHAAKGKSDAVSQALQGFADIGAVQENRTWSVKPQGAAVDAIKGAAQARVIDEPKVAAAGNEPEWGVAKIGAPAAWAKGYTGKGVVVGIVDTGLDAEHEAIKAHYRGTQADGSRKYDYNWYDPAQGKLAPYDDGEHGTHVAGTTAGGTNGHVIGVAPDAKIIAAKAILGSGYNTTEATLKALQFMLAPTDVHGNNPRPELGADVVNNSWGNADQNDRTFLETWDGLVAAGITPVAAAGNDGPRAGTVSPPGSFTTGISVGATTSRDTMASFSSRGPSKFDPNAVVPLDSAPGARVTSSVPGGYSTFDGTSLASPHVTGAVALMLQAKPNATDAEIREALTKTATDLGPAGPDMDSGYGRINVDKAIDYLKAHGAAAPVAAAG